MWFLYMCAAYVIQTVDESILKQKYEQAETVTATLSDALEESIESDETSPITDAQTGTESSWSRFPAQLPQNFI